LDELVGQQVLKTVEPAAVALSLQAAGDIERERERRHEQSRHELERASYNAERARRQFDAVDPSNRLVARELERRWEEALRVQRELHEQHARLQAEEPRGLTAVERARIEALASELPALWRDPTTSAADRQAVVRCLVERVVVNIEGQTEVVAVAIHWAGGFVSHHEIRRPIGDYERLRDFEHLRARLAELRREGKTCRELADCLNAEGFHPPQQGHAFNTKLVGMLLLREALAMFQKLYPKDKYPQGHTDLAYSLDKLGGLLQDRGDFAGAEPPSREALAMFQKLYPKDKYPQGHTDLARSLHNLGTLLQARGDIAGAELLYRDGLAMHQKLYPKDKYPQGHTDLAYSLNTLGGLLKARGDSAEAEPLLREALDMCRKLYPKDRYPQGHGELATSLSNLGLLLQARGDIAAAEPLFREALAMYQKLYTKDQYPHGHRELAQSLSNLGGLLHNRGDLAGAEPLAREALAMDQKLYPKDQYPQGHRDLATSLSNLGLLLQARGDIAGAEPHYRDGLAMYQKLYTKDQYPQGHRDLADSLSNLGGLLYHRGDLAGAEPLVHEALAMNQNQTTTLSFSVSEVQALNFVATLPRNRDAYLSITRRLPDAPAASAYALVWQSKAALTRVYQQRQLALLADANQEARSRWQTLLGLRRQRELLLLAPAPADSTARDQEIRGLSARIEQLDRDIRTLLPDAARAQRLADSSPADLQKRLPDRTALIDLLRYIDFEQDPRRPGRKGQKLTPCYVAFVARRDQVVRVELGAAAPIEEAVADWRQALTAGRPGQPDLSARHAESVRRLVWEPLARHLPTGSEKVYLAPDAALTGLPWAALPGRRPGTVLLEDHALALVPHAPFLLDRLTKPPPKAREERALLAVGGVRYDDRPAPPTTALAKAPELREGAAEVGGKLSWDYLEGSARELQRVVALAGGRPVVRLTGAEAGAERLLAELPRAGLAHLATHGFFADKSFRSILQLDEKLFARRMSSVGHILERIGEGSRSPLVLSGLVLAGANRPDTPGRGILTADAIVGLDLRNLELAVLSACETGLGDVAAGEGVFGLQRAFHIAGTANVVASLWKVNDEATAALMALFYRNLWDLKNPLPPREALRRAQLALFYHPESIPAWARGERGPNLKDAHLPTQAEPSADKDAAPASRAPARLWAAFVLSGLGD
jgi:CHAT domain-containing protein